MIEGNRNTDGNHWKVMSSGSVIVHESAEELWEAAVAYFDWCDNNPLTTEKAITSGKAAGTYMKEKHKRPYTIKGLCMHCGILQEYIMDILQSKDKDSMYYTVCTRILYSIHTQNLEHAVVGIYNPIFTAKLLNMDKEEAPTGSVKVEIINDEVPLLSNSENEILEKLDLENESLKNTKEKNA